MADRNWENDDDKHAGDDLFVSFFIHYDRPAHL